MAALAKAVGFNGSSSYQRYETDDNYANHKYLRAEMGEKLKRALVGKGRPPITEAEVWALCGPLSPHQHNSNHEVTSISPGDTFKPRRTGEATLPLRGFLKQGEQGYYYENGAVSDFVGRPAELDGIEEAYAMQLRDYSMPPFEPGWYATFDPTKPVRAGDLVAVYLRDGQAMFKKLVKISTTEIVIRQYDPPKDMTFKMQDIEQIHRFATIHAERP